MGSSGILNPMLFKKLQELPTIHRLFRPCFMTFVTRNRLPSSIAHTNSIFSFVLGCIHRPPSALTVANLGGKVSRLATCFGWIRLFSWQIEQVNF